MSSKVVAVLGSGGRESAICWKLSQSPLVSKIFCIPGNGYTASGAANKVCNGDFKSDLGNPANFELFSNWCKQQNVDLVVVGPELYLAAGISNYLTQAGIGCFGPSKEAAELEWNKAFAKQFFQDTGLPTAKWKSFSDSAEAVAYINSDPAKNLIVKAAGLAAGKGVIVAENAEEAIQSVREILDKKIFGDAGATVVIEEKLYGPEVSVLCFTDGETVKPMPAAQDAKRVFEGDHGPNTGGMGAYCPVHPSILDEGTYGKIVEYMQKTVDAMRKAGKKYVGVLYGGLMLTAEGPKFLEFNCRFGDPETEALLPLLDSDLYQIFESCVKGKLRNQEVAFSRSRSSVCVVLAGKGYPESSDKGTPIKFEKGFNDFQMEDGLLLFPAGVASNQEGLVTNGGRILAVVGLGASLLEAHQRAQKAALGVKFEGMHYRRDIGHQSLWPTVLGKSELTYKKCDVDIDEGDRLVDEFIANQAKDTARSGLLHGVGGFGGMFDLTQLPNYTEPVLVSGTDGVGTKLLIAEEADKHSTIGIDLVAMSVNDILTHNAEPLYFLDYFATGKLKAEVAGKVIEGIIKGCKDSNCSLIGGETAEMPGMYPPGKYDLAGFAVGVANKSELLPRTDTVAPGDVIIGIPSSGVHSNGYSLVRRVVKDSGLSYSDPAPFSPEASLGDALLTPTKLYVKALLPIMRGDFGVKAVAHITGGGLTENIPRILPKNCNAHLDAQSWDVLPVFSWLAVQGKVSPMEMARTFNLGIGMIVVVSADKSNAVLDKLRELGENPSVIGSIVPGEQKVTYRGLESSILSSYVSWSATALAPKATTSKKKVGVLISGTGTNMVALVEHTRNPALQSQAEIAIVISNHPDAAGVQKARELGIPVEVINHKDFANREAFDKEITKALENNGIEVVCLAGFMRILTGTFISKWRGRIINTHPALLPSFKGIDGVQMALDYGVAVSGSSVHFVEEEVDAGGVILQHPVPVYPDDTRDSLSERIKAVEHIVFPKAMEAVCRGDVVRGDNGKVKWNNYRAYFPTSYLS